MRSLPLLLALLLFALPAWAERRVALVIGVSAYQHADPLPNPVNDAADMASALEATGFTVVEAYDPDYAAMQRALRDFGRELDKADVALVFFAGHGVQVDGHNYLLPVDAELNDDASAQREAVDMAQILALLATAPRTSLVFLDACRNNPLARNMARRAGAARSLAVSQGLAQVGATAADTLIAYSTQPGAVAADGRGRNSPFTEALLHSIATPGLDVQELMRRVRNAVVRGSSGLQVPWDNSSLTKGFAFVAAPPGQRVPSENTWVPPAREPSPRQLDLALWESVRNGAAEEVQNYLRQYPQGIFADAARARLAALQRLAGAQREQARDMAQVIAQEFARISGSGAIIAEPKEPHEFYANARTYEQRGDYANARRSYLGFFRFGTAQVDPHFRFQAFLRVQEGRAGAREIYQDMLAQRRDDQTLQFAAALLQEAEPRKAALERIVAARPDFAPALYQLAGSFSEAALGTQTNADKERERALLASFVQRAEQGAYLRWYIDQQVAAEQLEDARRRLTALTSRAVATNVALRSMNSNAGWTLIFVITEPAQEVLVAREGQAAASLGMSGNIDPRSGRPMPNTMLNLPQTARAETLQVSYRDASGTLRGPFPLRFDPETELFAGMKQILEMTNTSWLMLQRGEGRVLVYWSQLASFRCGIAELRYGLDRDTPDRVLTLPACDRADPNAIRGFNPYFEAPAGTRFATVQLRYRDGSQSAVQRFEAR
jgi:uncharacterized caspase-like protein